MSEENWQIQLRNLRLSLKVNFNCTAILYWKTGNKQTNSMQKPFLAGLVCFDESLKLKVRSSFQKPLLTTLSVAIRTRAGQKLAGMANILIQKSMPIENTLKLQHSPDSSAFFSFSVQIKPSLEQIQIDSSIDHKFVRHFLPLKFDKSKALSSISTSSLSSVKSRPKKSISYQSLTSKKITRSINTAKGQLQQSQQLVEVQYSLQKLQEQQNRLNKGQTYGHQATQIVNYIQDSPSKAGGSYQRHEANKVLALLSATNKQDSPSKAGGIYQLADLNNTFNLNSAVQGVKQESSWKQGNNYQFSFQQQNSNKLFSDRLSVFYNQLQNKEKSRITFGQLSFPTPDKQKYARQHNQQKEELKKKLFWDQNLQPQQRQSQTGQIDLGNQEFIAQFQPKNISSVHMGSQLSFLQPQNKQSPQKMQTIVSKIEQDSIFVQKIQNRLLQFQSQLQRLTGLSCPAPIKSGIKADGLQLRANLQNIDQLLNSISSLVKKERNKVSQKEKQIQQRNSHQFCLKKGQKSLCRERIKNLEDKLSFYQQDYYRTLRRFQREMASKQKLLTMASSELSSCRFKFDSLLRQKEGVAKANQSLSQANKQLKEQLLKLDDRMIQLQIFEQITRFKEGQKMLDVVSIKADQERKNREHQEVSEALRCEIQRILAQSSLVQVDTCSASAQTQPCDQQRKQSSIEQTISKYVSQIQELKVRVNTLLAQNNEAKLKINQLGLLLNRTREKNVRRMSVQISRAESQEPSEMSRRESELLSELFRQACTQTYNLGEIEKPLIVASAKDQVILKQENIIQSLRSRLEGSGLLAQSNRSRTAHQPRLSGQSFEAGVQ